MPAQKVWAPHGTVKRYRQGGCDDLNGGKPGAGDRCADCIQGMSEYNARMRAGDKTPHAAKVTSIDEHRASRARTASSNTKQNNTGAMERAVAEQLAPYAEESPAYVQLAVSLAQVIDDPDRASVRHQNARQLQAVMDKLGQGKKKKSRGRLAAVQAITR